MDSKKTYLEPVLVDLGDVLLETKGVEGEGPEAVNFRHPSEDI